MSLFNIKDIKPNHNTDNSESIEICRNNLFVKVYNSNNYKELKSKLSSIDYNTNYFITSFGTFSMHHLLLHLLSFTGPAYLYATSWAFATNVANILLDTKKSGLIKEGYLLFDYRVQKYRPKVHTLLKNNFVSKVTSCHAKITIIQNKSHTITCVGSANYTLNNRIESFVISPGKSPGQEYINWIKNKIYESD
jgi:hypothetical protein